MELHRTTPTLLVVDGSSKLRNEVCPHLAAAGFTVICESHDLDLDHTLRVARPDVAVVELAGDANVLLRRLRAERRIPVVLLLRPDAPDDVHVDALRAGADVVLVKPIDVGALVERVIELRDVDDHTRTVVGDVVIDETGHTVSRSGEEISLTLTQFNLLLVFALNAGRVLSKRQLLTSVWGFDDYDVNLVEVHVSALRRKLEEYGPRMIYTVRGIGYVMRSSSVMRLALAAGGTVS